MRATTIKKTLMLKTLISFSGLVLAAVTAMACGELTGPESPTTPTNVVATLASPSSVNLSWTPSPLNDGVVSYIVYRNGNRVGETTGTETTYTDTGLSPQTTYVYSVAANCVGGVVSARSVETAASTVTTLDVTAPSVVQTIPASGATLVSLAADITAVFSEPMDQSTINSTTFTVRITGGAPIAGAVSYNAETRRAVFVPTGALPNFSSITATLSNGIKDLAGNALPATSVQFMTRDEVPPAIVATSPQNGAVGVSPTAAMTMTFSENMDGTTINASNITLRATASGTVLAGTVTYNTGTRVATLTPSAPLTQSVNYTVSIGAGVRDAQGIAIVPTSFSFTTGDLTAPTVVSTVPADLATGVATNATISATFSEPMDPATINTTTFNVRPTATGVNIAGTVSYNAATNTATFTPAAPLSGATAYTAIVTTGARDAAGNPIGANKTWTFVTIDMVPPTVTAVLPSNNATNVPLNTTVQVTFSERMTASTINATNITLRPTSSATAIPATVTYDTVTNAAILTPQSPLSQSTQYTVTVTTGVRDASNNALVNQFTSTFTTVAVDVTPPTVTGVNPGNGATNVPTNSNIVVTFSEAMDPATLTAANITLTPTLGGAAIPAALSIGGGNTTVTLNPTSNLSNGTGYTLTVTTGVKDAAGNALAIGVASTFTTVPPADVTPPTVTASPAPGASSVALNSNIVVTFSEAMDPATLTGSNITLTPTSGGAAIAATLSINPGNTIVTLDPTANLTNNTSYTITVTTGVKDVAGNALAATFTSTFTTPDTVAPTVSATSPLAGATAVARNTVITVTFSEAMDEATVENAANFTVTAGGAVAGTIVYDTATRVATFTPTAQLAASAVHTVTLTSGVRDVAGNALASAPFSFSFTTGP